VSREPVTPELFGRDVLGPVVAEFCLRLWSLGSLMERRQDAALLFCTRGGLRIQLAYERFLAASGLPSPVYVAPLMVSRVAAIRPALVRTVDEDLDALPPSTASTLSYEFPRASMSGVALAMAGVAPSTAAAGRWEAPFTPDGFVALLRHPDGRCVADTLTRQATLFTRHLRDALGGRRHAVLVDTGLYGTTRQLLAEGVPDIDFSSALIARSHRPGLATRNSRTFGLSVEADGYSPLQRRTAMLRYWHFIEWLFEPELPSVRTFADNYGVVRSNLEVDGWRSRIGPVPGTPFHGIVEYLDALPHAPAERIVADADRAWSEFRRAVVWPDRAHGHALGVGTRSHDFGTDATWSARPWRGPIAALRGASMWREGEIARSGTPLRRPLLAAIEMAYGSRRLTRAVTGRSRMP
jgi:hypothetical protein